MSALVLPAQPVDATQALVRDYRPESAGFQLAKKFPLQLV
jgi:hypothetical protein